MKIWPSSDKAKNKNTDQYARMIRAPVTTKKANLGVTVCCVFVCTE